MGKPKNVARLPNVPWQDTPSTEASGIQEERKSGEKMSGNTPAPMDGASGGSMGGESGQMNGGCSGCMGCGMGPMGCPCGGCNMGCPCGGMGCPCGGMMMPMMMQLGLFFSECRVPEKEEKKESGSDDDLIFQAGKKSLPLPNSFFVKLQTSDYETDIRSKLHVTGGPGRGSKVGGFCFEALRFCFNFWSWKLRFYSISNKISLQGWLLMMEKSFLPKKVL